MQISRDTESSVSVCISTRTWQSFDGQPTSKVLQSHTNIGALPSLQLCRILQRIAMAFLLMAHGVVRKAL